MSFTRVLVDGTIKQLDRATRPDEQVTEADVQDPKKLARVLTQVLKDVSTLLRRWNPKHLDFEDQVCFANNTLTLRHGFNGRVRWYVVEWTSNGTPLVDSIGNTLTVYCPMLTSTSASDANTLVLQSRVAGTATIRVEQAG